jgi:Flp pilus assembly protein TadG
MRPETRRFLRNPDHPSPDRTGCANRRVRVLRTRGCVAGRGVGGEAGQVEAFTVVMVLALVIMAGLVLDGGLALAAKIQALNEAQEAARAGAQALDLTLYRNSGQVRLAPDQAQTAAQDHLAAAGSTGTVTVTADEVTVTVHRDQDTQILGLVGVGSLQVSATATARAAHGVVAPEP